MAAYDYERTVETATGVLRQFAGSVLLDIDEEIGGIGWWDGQVDFRRRVVLSEYLLDSVNGAAEALLDAAMEAQAHREAHFADDAWLRRMWTAVAEASDGKAENEALLRSMQRDGTARRRDRQIDASATHVVSHLLRSLDCLSASFLIVGAIPRAVRRADWKHVAKLAEQCADGSTSPNLEPLGSAGRQLQIELFGHALKHTDHGPTDWLEWLNATRNSRIHRGARINWHLLHGANRRAAGLVRPFPPNPDLTDVELMGQGPLENVDEPFASLRLLKHSTAVIDGCVRSMANFVIELVGALAECWDVRRKSPTVLCQRGAQWQDLQDVPELSFPGYGEDPKFIGNQVHVGPELAKRLKSAHVMDHQRLRWSE
jgi:hypothetical protein